MHEIFVIHLRLHVKDEIRSGYLGNETTIKPKLDIRKIDDDELQNEFHNIVFFLSHRYAKHILNKLRNDISAKYKTSNVDYDIVKMKASQQQLNALMANQWKYEKA